MKTSRIQITFNEEMGCYAAEESGPGLCVAFGESPEEAVAKLEFAKTLRAECEICAGQDTKQGGQVGHDH
jgi:hypothetical protein